MKGMQILSQLKGVLRERLPLDLVNSDRVVSSPAASLSLPLHNLTDRLSS
jgi:hypothetical protein